MVGDNINGVRKFKKFAIFQNLTFELCVNITILTKNRSETNGCTSWLCYMCNSRAELLEIGREIQIIKDKLCLLNFC
jgi:hypothetical protein